MKYFDLQHHSVQYLLEQWGKWAASGKVKNIAPGTLAGLTGSTVKAAYILDEDAEVIDRIVARLKFKDPEMGEAICYYFINKRSIRDIAKMMKLSKHKADKMITAGIAWIDGCLSEKVAVAA